LLASTIEERVSTHDERHHGVRLECPLSAKSEVIIPSKMRRAAMQFPQSDFQRCQIGRAVSAQRAICWSGMGFLWHCFWAYCKLNKQTHAFPNIPFDGDDLH
jgi:hypothetical protein